MPRPEHWGGYALEPETVEFWQGRESRMHDRFLYARRGGGLGDREAGAVSDSQKTFVFFPEGAYGPTNNCVGIGDVLRRRGHRVVFVIEESFAGTLEEKGFEERADAALGPLPSRRRSRASSGRTSSARRRRSSASPPSSSSRSSSRRPGRRCWTAPATWTSAWPRSSTSSSPDAIVEDNVCAFPAIPASGLPWVRIVSCNPLEVKDPELPPTFGGLPLEDRSEWEAFRAEYARTTGAMQASFSEFCVERGAPPLPDGEMIHSSERLNLYLYPEAVDYPRSRPLDETLAQPRQLRPRDRRGLGAAGRGRRGGGVADLRQPRLARVGRRAADGAAGRGPG